MSDLISRQDAIRLVHSVLYEMMVDAAATEIEKPMSKEDKLLLRVNKVVCTKLKNMPSAQPEKHTEERTETHACDCISRQAAIDALSTSHGILYPIRTIEALPSAEPVQKKGKWIYGENDCQDGWFCSECRFFIPWDYDYYGLNNINFIKDFHVCPHCKAEMVTYTGKKEDTDEHSG